MLSLLNEISFIDSLRGLVAGGYVCFVNKQAFSFQNAVTTYASILRSKTGHNSEEISHP